MKKTVRMAALAAVLSVAVAMTEMPMALAMESNGTVGTEAGEGVPGEDVPGTDGTPDAGEGAPEETPLSSEPDADIEVLPPEGSPDAESVPEEKTISIGAPETSPVTVAVPIYNYDIVNVVVPASYAVALNPYEFPIQMGDGSVSTAQVLSHNYGIVNKSSRDKIVRVTLTLEDQNEGRIVFVDTPEEALAADADTYAVYLAAVPAAEGIGLSDASADDGTLAESLGHVSMVKAESAAVALKAGENRISFKLSKAIYDFPEGNDIALGEAAGQDVTELFELKGLAEDGRGATAFTFDGVLNPRADWAKLLGGLKISVVYTYENAAGEESIVEGTGAMVAP